ncbi:glycosyltransferase family 2 protein [Nesterenkonia sp. E16_7]|uniref:glycosyltransferase family 2 protein n=1 Tax=unclassified Nesterenkonia TaxID=2629769 RepID=UPI001A92BE86|nr:MULTISPECIES: glycosyltransferase family 2 protein [unclassified Nesterenkonia]MBO0596118.1 glycosyltransferase family 2 protein [Nesterenkonia sp. E16_10]MBO0599279.1 glycosyltransferase family 2 protein [Nesterenkonia sp. E16_7]
MSTIPDHLLEEYSADARGLGASAEVAALQARSPDMREIFAYAASDGKAGWEEVQRQVMQADFRGLDPLWLAKLARVCGLQDLYAGDALFALTALRHTNRLLWRSQPYRRFHVLEIQLLMEQREFEEAELRIEENFDLRRVTKGYIQCDLKNPFLRAEPQLYGAWIEEFNRPFIKGGWLPLSVAEGSSQPFDRLLAAHDGKPQGTGAKSPLVSVIMTTYKPERHTVLAAVNSILTQTWRNLELIIVDDASPQEYQGILDEVEALDERLRVIRLTRNGGTYVARNEGMRVASGRFIAGQDSDDWSHPERIRAQVDYLTENPETPGVMTSALRTDEDLVMTWRGRDPRRPCEVSLMVRRTAVDLVGGYLPARKAADSEFRMRVSAAASEPVGRLVAPLYLIRLLPNSLSRGDYLPGWSHPSRMGFRRSYARWHATAPQERLHYTPGTPVDELDVVIPGRFQLEQPEPSQFDVAYLADWRGDEGVQRAALDELDLLVAAGRRVAVIHMDTWKYCGERMGPFLARLQDGINERKWSLLRLDEAAEVGLLVVRDPRSVQFLPAEPSHLETRRLIILADESPAAGEFNGYDVESCTDNARQLFGVEPMWGATQAGLPVLEGVRREGISVLPETIPYALSDEQWLSRPRARHRERPVVGRHARVLDQAWPKDSETLALLWPLDGAVDVWVRGNADDALQVLGAGELPSSWVLFPHQDLPVRPFLNTVDFYVPTFTRNAPHEVREVFEAIASGCIAIVPETFRPLLGQAALYATPSQVSERIHEMWRSPEAMNLHRRSAAELLRRRLVRNADFVQLIQSVLSNEASSDKSGEFVAGNV